MNERNRLADDDSAPNRLAGDDTAPNRLADVVDAKARNRLADVVGDGVRNRLADVAGDAAPNRLADPVADAGFPAAPNRLADDGEACAALLRDGSRTFHAASRVLPRQVRRPAIALYAFCRLADDAVDTTDQPLLALARLRERLDRAYAGRPHPVPADRQFAAVVVEYGIPRALPGALLEGFEWDARGRRYETLADLRAYAARVAGSVGAMMALLMGAREPAVVARASDLGIAMQLTNIARDVGEDARAGRLYLPRAWLREAGIEPDAWLAAPQFTPALASVVQRLLAAADELYARASAGIACLPATCRPGMHAARLLYAEIGREVERRGLDSVSQRAIVHWTRKARTIAAALAAATARPPGDASPAVEEAQYLVDAVRAAPIPARFQRAWPEPAVPARAFDERVGWLVDLFERLERRDRGTAALRQI